jgi:TPR repeat protein
MKLITIFLLVGMLAVSGWAEDKKPEPYSPELVGRAVAGDARAQCNLGVCYAKGEGVTQDYKEAVKWLTKSAEQEFMFAQANLGSLYHNGNGVTKDQKEAVRWWTKAAEQGNAGAQFFLGVCYYQGKGVTQDYKEAVKWYTKAAEQGDAKAKEALERLKSK